MKKLILAITMVLATTLISTRAVAAEKKMTTKTVTTSSTSSSWSESKMRYGFGFTTYGSGTPVGAGGAISFMMEFNDMTSLQPFFTINTSSPFAFSVGGVLRHTLHGGRDNGLHGGLGFNLGTAGGLAAAAVVAGGTTFFVNIFPVVGYHFSLGGHVSNIKLSFDVGPIFEITPTFQFKATPLSGLGGASLHYMF